MQPPSPGHVVTVLILGDSIGIDLGQQLQNELAKTPYVSAILDGHVATGLVRPDYFNWPAELQADLAKYQPQAVVIFIGANDGQNMVQNGKALTFGTPAWDAAYGERVGSMMSMATSEGARVMWIGLPPMQAGYLNSDMQQINAIDQAQAQSNPGVSFFPSWPVLSGPGGSYSAYLPDSSGQEVDVRTPDGIHLTPAGADRLAVAAIGDMDHQWAVDFQP